MLGDNPIHGLVVVVEDPSPRCVTPRSELLGRRDDIGEQNCGEWTIDLGGLLFCADEGFDLSEDFAGITEKDRSRFRQVRRGALRGCD